MLWFKFILGLKFFELGSILFAIVPDYCNEISIGVNLICCPQNDEKFRFLTLKMGGSTYTQGRLVWSGKKVIKKRKTELNNFYRTGAKLTP